MRGRMCTSHGRLGRIRRASCPRALSRSRVSIRCRSIEAASADLINTYGERSRESAGGGEIIERSNILSHRAAELVEGEELHPCR